MILQTVGQGNGYQSCGRDIVYYPISRGLLKYLENEYCLKHQCVPVNKLQSLLTSNSISSAPASGSSQSSFDPYDLSTNDEKYFTTDNMPETKPTRIDRAARLLTTASYYFNLPPEAPNNWGQINPNLNDYHSNQMKFSITFSIPDLTNWWCKQEETHSQYADLSNVVRDINCIITHGVNVKASFSLGRDVIGGRQSKSPGEALCKTFIVTQFSRANTEILACTHPELENTNTENDSEIRNHVQESKLHRMAKVYNILEMWQGSQKLRATQKTSRTQNKQMTDVGYILDTEEIIKAFWSLFQHDGMPAFKLSERIPLPPPSCAKDHPGGHTQIVIVRRI